MIGFRPLTIDCSPTTDLKTGLGDILESAVTKRPVYSTSQVIMTGSTLIIDPQDSYTEFDPLVKAGPEAVVYVHGFLPLLLFACEHHLVDRAIAKLGTCDCDKCHMQALKYICPRCDGDLPPAEQSTKPTRHNCCRVTRYINALLDSGMRHHPDLVETVKRIERVEKQRNITFALVQNVQLVARKSIFGYVTHHRLFVKVVCCEPYDPPRIGSLILRGLLEVPVQCYELHVSAVVRFMRSCGIAGPEWLYFDKAKCFLRNRDKACQTNVFEFDVNIKDLLNGATPLGTVSYQRNASMEDVVSLADHRFMWDVRQVESVVRNWTADLSFLDSQWESDRDKSVLPMQTTPNFMKEVMVELVNTARRLKSTVQAWKGEGWKIQSDTHEMEHIHHFGRVPYYSNPADSVAQHTSIRKIGGTDSGTYDWAAHFVIPYDPTVYKHFVYFKPPPTSEEVEAEYNALVQTGRVHSIARSQTPPRASQKAIDREEAEAGIQSATPKSSAYERVDRMTKKCDAYKRIGRFLYVYNILDIQKPVVESGLEPEESAIRYLVRAKRDRGVPEIDSVQAVLLMWDEYRIGVIDDGRCNSVLLTVDKSKREPQSLDSAPSQIIVDESCDQLNKAILESLGNNTEPEKPNEINLVRFLPSELELLRDVFNVIKIIDPSCITGWNQRFFGIGYLLSRYYFLTNDSQCWKLLSRFREDQRYFHLPIHAGLTRLKTKVGKIGGRVYLNGGKLCREEIRLNDVTFLNIVKVHLKLVLPRFTLLALSEYWKIRRKRPQVLRYAMAELKAFRGLLYKLGVIGKFISLSGVFCVEWPASMTRGSQFFVEALMLSASRNLGLVLPSLSKTQVRTQDALEGIPMVLEPRSRCYHSPVIVVDFQSLYPSLMIAYNICYSTCLGKAHRILKFIQDPKQDTIKIGALDVAVDKKQLIGLLAQDPNNFHVMPNGVVFCSKSVREGVVPTIMRSVLSSRILVKRMMKKRKMNPEALSLLNFNQMALKFVSVTTYGYMGASVTGRMPCGDLADGIVTMARHILEEMCHTIEQHDFGRPVEVVYGDTDSCFIHVPNASVPEAFAVGKEITRIVTTRNLHPLELKLEKVYESCILQTKKRYIGHAYESVEDYYRSGGLRLYKSPSEAPFSFQTGGFFDSKGTEASRRDQSTLIQLCMKRILKALFSSSDLSYLAWHFNKLLKEIYNCCRPYPLIANDMQELVSRAFLPEEDYSPLSFSGSETRSLNPSDFVATKRLKLGHYSYDKDAAKPYTLPPQAVVALWCQSIIREGLPGIEKLETRFEPFARGRNKFNFAGNQPEPAEKESDSEEAAISDHSAEEPEGFMFLTGEGFGYVVCEGIGTINQLASLPWRSCSTPFFPVGREHALSGLVHNAFCNAGRVDLNQDYYQRIVMQSVVRMTSLIPNMHPDHLNLWLKHVPRKVTLPFVHPAYNECRTFAGLIPFARASVKSLSYAGIRGFESPTTNDNMAMNLTEGYDTESKGDEEFTPSRAKRYRVRPPPYNAYLKGQTLDRFVGSSPSKKSTMKADDFRNLDFLPTRLPPMPLRITASANQQAGEKLQFGQVWISSSEEREGEKMRFRWGSFQQRSLLCRRICLHCTGGGIDDVENCVDAVHCPVYAERVKLQLEAVSLKPSIELSTHTPRITNAGISLECKEDEFLVTGHDHELFGVGGSPFGSQRCGADGQGAPRSATGHRLRVKYHECDTISSIISKSHIVHSNTVIDSRGRNYILSCTCRKNGSCDSQIFDGLSNSHKVTTSSDQEYHQINSYSTMANSRRWSSRDLLWSTERHTFTIWSPQKSLGYLWPLECFLRGKNHEAKIISNGCALTNRIDLSIHKSFSSNQERRRLPTAPKGHLSFSLNVPSSAQLICTIASSSQPLHQDTVCGPKRLRQKINAIVLDSKMHNIEPLVETSSTTTTPPTSGFWQGWEPPPPAAARRRLGTSANFQEDISKRLAKLNADETSIVSHIKEQLNEKADFDPLIIVPYAHRPGGQDTNGEVLAGYMDTAKKGPILGRFGSTVKWDKWEGSFARDNRIGDTSVTVGNKNSVTVNQSVGVKNRSVDTNVKYKDTVSVDAGHDMELDQYHVGTFVKGYGVGIKRENDQDSTGVLVETPNVTVGVMGNVFDRNYGGRLRIKDLEVMARHDFDQHVYEDRRKMATELAVRTPKNVGVAVGTDVRQEKFGVGLGVNHTQFGIMSDLDDRQLKLTTNWKSHQEHPWHYYIEADLPDQYSRATHAAVGVGRTDKAVVTAGGGIGNDGIPEFMARWNGRDSAVQIHLDDKTNQKRKLVTGFSFGRFTYIWDSNLLLENIPIPILPGGPPVIVSP